MSRLVGKPCYLGETYIGSAMTWTGVADLLTRRMHVEITRTVAQSFGVEGPRRFDVSAEILMSNGRLRA